MLIGGKIIGLARHMDGKCLLHVRGVANNSTKEVYALIWCKDPKKVCDLKMSVTMRNGGLCVYRGVKAPRIDLETTTDDVPDRLKEYFDQPPYRDTPYCDVCGSLTVRSGACYKCMNCGNAMGKI